MSADNPVDVSLMLPTEPVAVTMWLNINSTTAREGVRFWAGDLWSTQEDAKACEGPYHHITVPVTIPVTPEEK